MARLRLFGPAREAAGVSQVLLTGRSVGDVVAAAEERFGADFSRVLEVSRIWVNGDDAGPDTLVNDNDEIAVVPPVSGGCA